jgi:hypothetical protein
MPHGGGPQQQRAVDVEQQQNCPEQEQVAGRDGTTSPSCLTPANIAPPWKGALFRYSEASAEKPGILVAFIFPTSPSVYFALIIASRLSACNMPGENLDSAAGGPKRGAASFS